MYLVSRTRTFVKLFFVVIFIGLCMYVALGFYSFYGSHSAETRVTVYQDRFNRRKTYPEESKTIKYVLVWTESNNDEDENLLINSHQKSILQEEGQGPFFNCEVGNCFVTTNKDLLPTNYESFDAIVFNTTYFRAWLKALMPVRRKSFQKYVFYADQAFSNPICNKIVDNYFNWTWTYNLDSDVFIPFIEVLDMQGDVIAPSKDIVWESYGEIMTKDVNNIDEVTTKTKAIIWVLKPSVEIRHSIVYRLVKRLKAALREHSLQLDVYGSHYEVCPNGNCSLIMQRDYYFYLVYEPSFSQDYVTDEVLEAYHHETVPILIGNADYSKFLPHHSYIDYQGFNEDSLAAFVSYTIRNPSKYREYFNWKKFYTIRKVNNRQHRGLCSLCALLNNNEKSQVNKYQDFRKWWHVPGAFKGNCLPKGAERFAEVLSYLNESQTISNVVEPKVIGKENAVRENTLNKSHKNYTPLFFDLGAATSGINK